MKTVTLDGKSFTDLHGFYEAIGHLLAPSLGADAGHNLDALNDMLRGGFGFHEYGEALSLIWLDYEASRACLGPRMTRRILRVMLSDECGAQCRVELR